MAPTKRKSTYDESDPFVAADDSPDDHHHTNNGAPSTLAPPKKRSKPTATTSSSTNAPSSTDPPAMKTDDDGNQYWELSKARRVTLSEFKGKKLVTVREYYEKDGKWLPGKKGISMTLEQYSAFISVMPQIEEVLGRDGEKVVRPRYDGVGAAEGGGGAGSVGVNSGDEDEAERERKANIEATSDEDED